MVITRRGIRESWKGYLYQGQIEVITGNVYLEIVAVKGVVNFLLLIFVRTRYV
jgi:hypothetical protein